MMNSLVTLLEGLAKRNHARWLRLGQDVARGAHRIYFAGGWGCWGVLVLGGHELRMSLGRNSFATEAGLRHRGRTSIRAMIPVNH
jgi:hypothetical protein